MIIKKQVAVMRTCVIKDSSITVKTAQENPHLDEPHIYEDLSAFLGTFIDTSFLLWSEAVSSTSVVHDAMCQVNKAQYCATEVNTL